MNEHSSEPWTYRPYSGPAPNFHVWAITNDVGDSFVVAIAGDTEEEAAANIQRIVACVNACKGIETKTLARLSSGDVINTLPQMLEAFCSNAKAKTQAPGLNPSRYCDSARRFAQSQEAIIGLSPAPSPAPSPARPASP